MPRKTRPVVHSRQHGSWLANLDIPGRRPGLLTIVGTAACLLASYVFYRQNPHMESPASFLPMVASILVMLGIWVANKLMAPAPRNWMSPDIIFAALYSVFHFTYMFYYTLGFVPRNREVFFSPSNVSKALLYSQVCLGMFLIAYEATGAFFRQRVEASPLEPADRRIITFSKIIVVTAIVFMLVALLSVGIGKLSSDYNALISIGRTPLGRFFWVAHSIGVVGLVLHCAASGLTFRRAMTGLLFPIFALSFIGLVLLLGDRGGFIQLAITPALAYYYFQSKLRWRWAILAVLALLFVSSVVALARNTVTLNPVQIYTEYQIQSAHEQIGPITRALLEFGVSLKTVVIAMHFVPSQHSYWWGKSYLDGLQLVLPNVIPGVIREQEGLGVWLNQLAFGSLRWTHGRGGSIAMEAYVNFGVVGGALTFLAVGAAYRWVYERFLARPNLMRTVILFASVVCLMLWMRNTSQLVPRLFMWPILAAWLAQSIWRSVPLGRTRQTQA
jgi:hypothetical protein